MSNMNEIDVFDFLDDEIQNPTLHSIYLTNKYDDEEAIIYMPLSATETLEPLAPPLEEKREDELLSILFQSPFCSPEVPSLEWLEVCMEESSISSVIDLGFENPAVSLKSIRVQNPAKKPIQAGLIDFTEDYTAKSSLGESVIDLTSENPAVSFKSMRLRRSIKKPIREGFLDFTRDCAARSRLDELYINASTTREKKELDDLEAILGCSGKLKLRKKRQSRGATRRKTRAKA